MIHNLVANFAGHLDMNRTNQDGSHPLFDYPVVSGSIFNYEFSETLDSATIVLKQIKKDNRLYDIKMYDYVRVYDKSTFNPETNKYKFDKIFLVDDYNEREPNLTEHFFGYTIRVMSETKLLEKFQCPNLTITHRLENSSSVKKTIYEYIQQYMSLYVPKIKFCEDGENWSYVPVIKMPVGDDYTCQASSLSILKSDFNVQGDEWEAIIYLPWNQIETGIDIEDVDVSSIEISNIQGHGNFAFQLILVSFEPQNNRFVIDVIVRQEPLDSWEGNVTFDVSFFSTVSKLFLKFNVPCADMSFPAPTLRQLLTLLMQQVSCIPVVKNRTLSFMDLKSFPVAFGNGDYTVNNTISEKTRSLSSDSFANTLINQSSNVLDNENEVIAESLGFRDRNNTLLKQEQNLFLETKLPIYKINSAVLNAYVKSKIKITNLRSSGEFGGRGESGGTFRWSLTIEKPDASHVKFKMVLSALPQDTNIRISGTLVAFKYQSSTQSFTISKTLYGSSFVPGSGSDEFSFLLRDSSFDHFYFVGEITALDANGQYESYTYDVFYCTFSTPYNNSREVLTLYSQNVTQLFVEKSVRQYLSTNFDNMVSETSQSNATLNNISKYVYGTVEYSIGSKKISGFSDVFARGETTPLGWITPSYTYIENIWNFIVSHYQDSIIETVRRLYGNLPVMKDYVYSGENPNPTGGGQNTSLDVLEITPYNPLKARISSVLSNPLLLALSIFTSNVNFAYLWFDIKYWPLNSFNLSFVKTKEELDFLIEQYDGNASGLTDFDRLSIHEQEQVDRIGNETMSILQRTTDINDIQIVDDHPFLYKDDVNRDGAFLNDDNSIDYIIFKCSFSVNNNYYKVSYTGSKDAVLKDYFTSIRTKYRAYQYVDYSQSVLRKERDVIFVRISDEDWYLGDDKIYFGNFSIENSENQLLLARGLIGGSFAARVKNQVSASDEEKTKNEVSVVYNQNSIAFVYEEYDNVSSGTYIDFDAFTQLENNPIVLGGIPQTWQIWEENFYNSHYVKFIGAINLSKIFDDYIEVDGNDEEIAEDFEKILKLPIIDDDFVQENVVFSVVENNSDYNSKGKRLFYKDGSETINHTVQFIYYSKTPNIIWREDFLKTSIVNDIYVVDLTGENFELEEGDYIPESNYARQISSPISISSSKYSSPSLDINWNVLRARMTNQNITQFKIISRVFVNGKWHYRDIVGFKMKDNLENGVQKFYFSLNDTKSDYVMAEENGVLYRKYKVKGYTEETVEPLRKVELWPNEEED